MRRRRFLQIALPALAILLARAPASETAPMLIGTLGESENCIPFGCPTTLVDSGTYQQVYPTACLVSRARCHPLRSLTPSMRSCRTSMLLQAEPIRSVSRRQVPRLGGYPRFSGTTRGPTAKYSLPAPSVGRLGDPVLPCPAPRFSMIRHWAICSCRSISLPAVGSPSPSLIVTKKTDCLVERTLSQAVWLTQGDWSLSSISNQSNQSPNPPR